MFSLPRGFVSLLWMSSAIKCIVRTPHTHCLVAPVSWERPSCDAGSCSVSLSNLLGDRDHIALVISTWELLVLIWWIVMKLKTCKCLEIAHLCKQGCANCQPFSTTLGARSSPDSFEIHFELLTKFESSIFAGTPSLFMAHCSVFKRKYRSIQIYFLAEFSKASEGAEILIAAI